MEKPDSFDTLKQSLQGLLERTMNVAMAANILETYTDKPVKKVGMFRDYNTFKPEEEELWVKYGDIRVYDVASELLFSGAALPTREGWILSLNKHSILWVECFDEWEDEDVIKHLHSEMFIKPRKLADGSWVAISRLTTTWSVCCDITRMTPYAYRWCFLDLAEAEYFLENIQEFDEIPERRSSLTGHRFSRYARLAAFDHLGLKRW